MLNVSNCRIGKYFMGGATENYNENMTERVAILIYPEQQYGLFNKRKMRKELLVEFVFVS